MSKKMAGLWFCLLGVFLLIVSFFSDYLRGRPQSFGPAQIALVLFSFAIIYLGFYLRGFKLKKVFLSLNIILLQYQRLVTIVFLVAIILLLIFPLQYVINYLSFPYPLEYRDAASIHAADAFSKGINPYRLENFPENMYLYGLMFPLVLAPFINLVDHPILAAKGLDVVFLFLFLGISFWIFRKRKASVISSLIGILILLNSTCFIWKINGTRPDILGLFFSIVSLCFLLGGKTDTPHILLSALAVVISFYFKQYMIFSAFMAAIYLFLFESKQKGILFVAAAITMGLTSFIVIRRYFPLYYEYSILHHLTIIGNDAAYMESQTKSFLRYYWTLCFLYIIYLFKTFFDFGLKRLKEIRLKLSNFKEPLICGFSVDLFSVGIIISTFILTFLLGRHQGNLYTYYGELLLPFLLFLIIPKIDALFKMEMSRYLIQALILAFCIFPFRENYATDFSAYENAFLKVTQYADQCSTIYDVTPLVALYKIEHEMYPIYNNGQIEYAWSAIPDKATILGKISAFPAEIFNQRLLLWDDDIFSRIEDQKFSCIFTEYDQEIENYIQAAQIENVLERTIYIMVPQNP